MNSPNEAKLKAALTAQLRLAFRGQYKVFRHEDRYVAGIPDISVNGKKTLWLEVKHAHPSLRHRGIQDLTVVELERLSHAAYVIYESTKEGTQHTIIALPTATHQGLWRNSNERAVGFDHDFVVQWVRRYML